MDTECVAVIARQELRVSLRSKWVQIFAAVFAVLTLAISYFGMVTSVVVGFEGFTRTTASLLNLVLYLIPMFALTASTLSFSLEKGAAEMLFSQPVRRTEILLGKILGLFGSLATAVVFGFGISGFVIAVYTGFEGMSKYLGFIGLTLLLLLTFLCLGAFASVISEGRARALGIALAMWFVFVLFYDLMALGLALLVNPHIAHSVILLSLFGNPVDLARVSGLLILGGATIFGAGGASLVRTFGSTGLAVAVLSFATLLWSVLVLTAAGCFLARREI
jgi:Cu-processing system permease protein